MRPARRPEFTASLGARVREHVGEPRTRSLRFGLAVALTLAIVVSLASVGGLSYAASASKRAAQAVRHAVDLTPKSRRTVAHGTAAQSQYNVTICHYSGSAKSPWVHISVSTSTVKTYLTRGDYIVTPANLCPPRVRCSITTILGRQVGVACNAGPPRAGKRCSVQVKRTVVVRGTIGKDGRYSTRFTVPTLLTRGTTIIFLVEGKVVATLHV